jgi:hypothetical protein
MKTLSGRFAIVVLAVIVIVALPSGCRKEDSKGVRNEEKCYKEKFALEFGKPGTATTPTEYAELKKDMKDAFNKALCALKTNQAQNQGQFKVDFLPNATATLIHDYDPPCSQVSINTDKITTSGVARTEPAEESAAYDPNAVYRVQSNSLKEIKDVLDTFEK